MTEGNSKKIKRKIPGDAIALPGKIFPVLKYYDLVTVKSPGQSGWMKASQVVLSPAWTLSAQLGAQSPCQVMRNICSCSDLVSMIVTPFLLKDHDPSKGLAQLPLWINKMIQVKGSQDQIGNEPIKCVMIHDCTKGQEKIKASSWWWHAKMEIRNAINTYRGGCWSGSRVSSFTLPYPR